MHARKPPRGHRVLLIGAAAFVTLFLPDCPWNWRLSNKAAVFAALAAVCGVVLAVIRKPGRESGDGTQGKASGIAPPSPSTPD